VSWAIIRLYNQVVIAVLSLHKPKPMQHIIDKILLQAERILEGMEHLEFSIEITWFKDHRRVQGNKRVNLVAKEAAWGAATSRGPPSQICCPRDPYLEHLSTLPSICCRTNEQVKGALEGFSPLCQAFNN